MLWDICYIQLCTICYRSNEKEMSNFVGVRGEEGVQDGRVIETIL